MTYYCMWRFCYQKVLLSNGLPLLGLTFLVSLCSWNCPYPTWEQPPVIPWRWSSRKFKNAFSQWKNTIISVVQRFHRNPPVNQEQFVYFNCKNFENTPATSYLSRPATSSGDRFIITLVHFGWKANEEDS